MSAAITLVALSAGSNPGMAQQALTMPLSCALKVDQAVDAATAGELPKADSMLMAASRMCPSDGRAGRELAAVRFKQGRYREAAAFAVQHLALAPNDSLAWQLLATSQYLSGDRVGALRSWNRIGLPVIDSFRLEGATRSRKRIASMMAWPDSALLTSTRYAMARRRLADLPTIDRSTVSYQVNVDGSVDVAAHATEDPVLEPAWRIAAATAIQAVVSQTIRLEVANATGTGERWEAEWRWEKARPRRAFAMDAPLRAGMPGVLGVAATWQGVRVATEPGPDGVSEDTWTSGTVRFGGWAFPALRPTIALGFEHWAGERDYLTSEVGLEFRAADDRFRASVTATHAGSLGSHPSHGGVDLRVLWTSSLGMQRTSWSARLGAEVASTEAPIGAWPLVTSSLSRGIVLRAEPSISNDALQGRATGRSILHAGVSIDQPLLEIGPLALGVGLFLDGAKIQLPAASGVGARHYLDGGAGLLVGLGGGTLGYLRLDVARGLLHPDRSQFAVGYHQEWPAWSREPR